MNTNLFITAEIYPFTLSIFRLRDMNNSDYNVLDFQSFIISNSSILGS
jgi:hypothetical protein